MKKYIKYLWMLLLAMGSHSCENFYETPLSSDISLSDIFADETTAETFLNATYYALPYIFPTSYAQTTVETNYKVQGIGSKLAVASIGDEGMPGHYSSGNINYYYHNGITSSVWDFETSDGTSGGGTALLEDLQTSRYQYIRKCMIYINNVESIPNATESFIKETKAEAYIIMCMFYYEMMYRYGSVPIIPYVMTGGEGDALTIGTRPALSDFVAQIDEWLEYCIENLPESYETQDLGRVPRAAAYFLRSRLWLWAASPIFNKRNDADYTTTTADNGSSHRDRADLNYSTSYDSTLWDKAAQYTKEAIDYCTSVGHKLVETEDTVMGNYEKATYGVPTSSRGNNPECIMFTRRVAATSTAAVGYALPYGALLLSSTNKGGDGTLYVRATSNAGGVTTSQNFVNWYRNADGTIPFSEDNNTITDAQRKYYAETANPWANLEERFGASILHQDQQIYGASTDPDNPDTIFKYNGDLSNFASASEWTYGYNVRKFLPDEIFVLQTAAYYTYDLVYVYMRLAELYLNYAECLWNQGNYSGAMEYLKPTMKRGGLPTTTMTFPTDADTTWEWIERERAVELAFEGYRYFDARRWLKGDDVAKHKYGLTTQAYFESTLKGSIEDYKSLYGITDFKGYIITDPSEFTQYTNRTFVTKHYLWPIMQAEIQKDCGWIQNPGYEL